MANARPLDDPSLEFYMGNFLITTNVVFQKCKVLPYIFRRLAESVPGMIYISYRAEPGVDILARMLPCFSWKIFGN